MRVNEALDHIRSDGQELVVFDPETGKTHVINEIGAAIIDILREQSNGPRLQQEGGDNQQDRAKLIEALAARYLADPAIIEQDISEFLDTLLREGVILY